MSANQPTDRVKHTRRKKEIGVSFRIRSEQAKDECPRSLQLRLSVRGECVAFNSGISVRPTQWNQKAQRSNGRTAQVILVNEQIVEVEAKCYEILRELKRKHGLGQGPRPTAQLVRQEFLHPGTTSPTLDKWYVKYLNFLDSMDGTQDAKAEKTIIRSYKTRDHLRAFCGMCLKPGSVDTTLLVSDITTGWGKQFYIWLQKDPKTGKQRMNPDSAGKYLSEVRAALSYAVDEGYLRENPLDRFKPKRKRTKEVYYLEPNDLDKLMGLQLKGGMGVALWWAKLMCLTGLDYLDAVRYAQNRSAYDRVNESGKSKIVITRSKLPRNECEIYYLPELDTLFKEYPTGPHAPVLADINRNLKVIAEGIGFPANKPFTSKICRKTAGAHFLRMGFLMSTVSKMLGHSTTRTTETHYVKVGSSHVDQDIDRVGRFAEIRLINPVAERELFRIAV